MQKKSFRLVDANLNRVKEGLRVCEDIVRFIYDDGNLTASFKRLRHDVSKAFLKFPVPYREIVAHRNSRHDVGKAGRISLKRKPDWNDLLIGNMKRAEEGLRVLEEAAKLIFPPSSRNFKKQRFRLYDLEKKVLGKF